MNEQAIEQAVHEAVGRVATERGSQVGTVTSELRLNADLGLKSLDLAQVIAILELKLNADPFAEHVAITSVRTVADLCSAYSTFFSQAATPATVPQDAADRAARRLGARK